MSGLALNTATSPKRANRRALSATQTAILSVLPPARGQPLTTGQVIEALGLFHPSAAQRTAVSRSLTRLEERELAVKYTARVLGVSGKGWLWSRLDSRQDEC